MAGPIVALPSDASTATSSEECFKALTHEKRKQSVPPPTAIAVRTPLVSVGALRAPSYPQLPNASLGSSLSHAAAPAGVGLPNAEHRCLSRRYGFQQRLGGAPGFMVRAFARFGLTLRFRSRSAGLRLGPLDSSNE